MANFLAPPGDLRILADRFTRVAGQDRTSRAIASAAHATAAGQHGAPRNDGPACRTTVPDPVCGMRIDPATAPEHRGTGNGAVYFCSAACAAAFDTEPRRYATAAAQDSPTTGTP